MRAKALIGPVVAIVTVAGCGGGSEPRRTHTAPGPDPLATGELERVGEDLQRLGYTVDSIAAGALPRHALEVSPAERRREALPRSARPGGGLTANLAGHARGLVYRFSSRDLAEAMAPSFLGRVWGKRAVYGCGHNIYFATRPGRAGSMWLADVARAVRRASDCHTHLAVIS